MKIIACSLAAALGFAAVAVVLGTGGLNPAPYKTDAELRQHSAEVTEREERKNNEFFRANFEAVAVLVDLCVAMDMKFRSDVDRHNIARAFEIFRRTSNAADTVREVCYPR